MPTDTRHALWGLPWFFQKGYLWARSMLSLRDSDVFLATFPKTGSTWVRFFLYNLLTAEEREKEITLERMDHAMPEFANPSMFNFWPHPCARLVKTHQSHRRIFRGHRSIVLMRDPRDTMVSLYYYMRASRIVSFGGKFTDLLDHPNLGIEAFVRFYASWLPHSDLCVRYEDLIQDPKMWLARIAAALGLNASDRDIERSAERSSLERTRKAQAGSSAKYRSQFRVGFMFARRGTPGEGANLFDEKAKSQYRRLANNYGVDFYRL